MGSFARVFAGAVVAALSLPLSSAQNAAPVQFTDPSTNITFEAWSIPSEATAGGLTFGVALPEGSLKTDATEFIGYLQCSSKDATATGWCGMSFGGSMTNALLLFAYPHDGQVLTSFRYATGYDLPAVYTGDAKLTQVASTINDTHYSVVFRCENCLSWAVGGETGSASTSGGTLVLGWAQAFPAPDSPECPDTVKIRQHDNGQGIIGAQLDGNATSPSYTAWAAKATKTVTGACTATSTTAPVSSVPVPTNATYDYVVVGGGAGGIPVADKLSEAGKRVLLIEKGPPSTGRWGGTLGPGWLNGTKLTRFDVPGLCNQIWVDSAGIACSDTDQMAGCVLGGGTAVNAGLWWKPHTIDWDYNFPSGWKAEDMAAATSRVFSRIPGTDHPSTDGRLYLQQGFDVLTSGFKAAGWKSVVANNSPNSKNHTYAHTAYMYAGGERGGPLATYLASASERSNFKLWTGTAVKRVIREGSRVTGVEVEAFRDGGYSGVVQLAEGGRAVLSAGTFGTAKILLRSGIGPRDQLEVVNKSADSASMIGQDSWISLPVGYNLMDHLNVSSYQDVNPDYLVLG